MYIISRKDKYDHFRIDLDFGASLNPSKENGITYHGGCENFTQDDWVEWLGYKPCILSSQGTIETFLNPDDYTKNLDGENIDISTVTPARNVMILFPRIGILSEHYYYDTKGSIRITNDPNAAGYGYSAYNNGLKKCHLFFAGAYPAYVKNNKMYSLSGKLQTTNGSLSSYRSYAKSVGTNYGILDHTKLALFHHLYIVQNGKIDGRMLSTPSADFRTTGILNTSGMNLPGVGTTARKILGMEGNGVPELIDGIYYDNNKVLRICQDGYYNDTYENYTYSGTAYSMANGYMSNCVTISEGTGVVPCNASGSSDNYFRCHVSERLAGKIEQAMASNIFDADFLVLGTTSVTLTTRLCFMN